jgi:hypothetical protein
MVGYHYTSYKNWLSIQETGLKIYPINHPALESYFEKQVFGIWTWATRPTGKSELGSIIFQTSVKQSTKIILLEFDYNEKDILRNPDNITGKVNLYHDGVIGSWYYHKDELAYIVTTNIAPENIRLVKEFNLMDLVA